MSINEEIERGKKIGNILINAFKSQKGIFGHREMPENELPNGVKRGSEKHLQFITLVVSLDYMKDAHKFWNNARKSFNDEKLKFLYDLEHLENVEIDTIEESLVSAKLARMRKQDARTWKKIGQSILSEMDGSVLDFIKRFKFKGKDILNFIKSKDEKKKYPYLSGDKIGPLWIRILYDVCDIPFVDLDKIPIPVDIHIARSTFATGGLWGSYSGKIYDSKIKEKIMNYWFKVVEGEKFISVDLDEPLWNLSKFGCANYKFNGCSLLNDCPVGQYCVKGDLNVSSEKIEINTNLQGSPE